MLASGGFDARACVWDAITGKRLSLVRGSDLIAAEMEEVVDLIVG